MILKYIASSYIKVPILFKTSQETQKQRQRINKKQRKENPNLNFRFALPLNVTELNLKQSFKVTFTRNE